MAAAKVMLGEVEDREAIRNAKKELRAAKQDLSELASDQTAVTSARQAAEWGMRSLQGAFGRLKLPLDPNDDRGRYRLLLVCVRIHQLRARVVGVNQLKNVFVPAWRDCDTKAYDEFEKMLFSDIIGRDRIGRFYNLPVDGE